MIDEFNEQMVDCYIYIFRTQKSQHTLVIETRNWSDPRPRLWKSLTSQDSPAIIVKISLRNFLLMQFEVNISIFHCRWLYFFIFLRRPLLLVDGPDLSGRLIEKGAVWWIEVRHVMQLLSIIFIISKHAWYTSFNIFDRLVLLLDRKSVV